MNPICKICSKEIIGRHHLTKICPDCNAGDYGLGRSRAHQAIQKAIKCGTLPYAKEFLCVDCGKKAECYDHRDYNKPLDVQPVCRKCNFRRGSAIPLNMANAKPKKKQNKPKQEQPENLVTNLL